MNNTKEKEKFHRKLSEFADTLGAHIALKDEWTIKGFIDIFKNVYTLSEDTKIISKVLELHLFPMLLIFAEDNGYDIELADYQNWYPDMTFILKEDHNIKFAVDLKTTYRNEKLEGWCNGFTLGSHGEYFVKRDSNKNIQYPYNQYSGHFCLGIIYSRVGLDKYEETRIYGLEQLESIPSVIKKFTFFAEEKWRIAGDKGGSGNTANIGSIKNIKDILNGDGVFAKAGEKVFDDYWINFGNLQILDKDGKYKALSSFEEYLAYRGLPEKLNNKKSMKRKRVANDAKRKDLCATDKDSGDKN